MTTSINLEQIYHNIDIIGQTLEQQPDLSSDVLPFIESTLTTLKVLAKDSQDFNVNYELLQIATNYIPKAIQAYCSLPLEYRNKNIIKNNMTARDFLIKDLTIVKKQVVDLEKTAYGNVEKELEINSRVISQKYDGFELAREISSITESGFVNQFDYSKYQKNPSYKNIFVKQRVEKPETHRMEDAKKFSQTTLKILKSSFLYTYYKALKPLTLYIIKNLKQYKDNILTSSIIIGIVGLFIFGIVSLLNFVTSTPESKTYMRLVDSSINSIYSVMKSTHIPKENFNNFVLQAQNEVIKNNIDRASTFKLVNLKNESDIKMTVSALSKVSCNSFIDKKENNYNDLIMSVNNIELPKNNIVSNADVLEDDNHKLCYLADNNQIAFTFNNDKIFKGNSGKSTEELNNDLLSYKNQLTQYNIIRSNNVKKGYYTGYVDVLIDKVNSNIEDINKIIKTK